jgi:argininosuccinate synthase
VSQVQGDPRQAIAYFKRAMAALPPNDPLKADIEAFLASSQRCVNGEVTLETQGGTVGAVSIRSPHILNAKGATYAQSADWGVAEAEGFIRLYGMSSTLWAEVNR